MKAVGNFFRKVFSSRLAYLQILLVFVAFGLMVQVSFTFGLRLERAHLESDAEDMFLNIEAQLKADLKELETMTGIVSESVRLKLMQGADYGDMVEYITAIAEYCRLMGVPGFFSVFGYFNIPGQIERNAFSASAPETDWPALEAAGLIDLNNRDWYVQAVSAYGGIAVTQPYADIVTGEVAMAYSRALYDDEGHRIAVVGLNVYLDRIYGFSVSADNHGKSSWMIFDKNLNIIAFPFPELLGVHLSEAHESGISDIAAALAEGHDVSGHRFTDYGGRENIISVRPIDNGWYLGVATPVESYYENLRSMLWFLIGLGALMASVLSAALIYILAGKEEAVKDKKMFLSLGSIMNGIDAMIYVTDPVSSEILFMNDAMKQHFKIGEDPIGKLCYSVLQENQDRRCRFCPCFKLNVDPDTAIVWEEHSTKTGRTYRNTDSYIDWPERGKVHIQHSVDMTELIAAKEAAENSNKAKSTFLSHISHELRTPLNAVLGTAEIQLQKEVNTPDIEEAFNRIHNSGNLLLNIINDLLDLSKIEAGRLELSPDRYNIPSLIHDTIQLNILRYESKDVGFSLQLDPDTPQFMFGDELRIKQILNNLLSNAFKYTDAGTIDLSVAAETFESSCALLLSVRDTGHGMTKEQVDRLFEEYTRFNTEATRTVVGTGLGMTITKRLIDMMGGEITVESELGKGSVFSVRLPQEPINSEPCGTELSERLRSNRFHSLLKLRKAKLAHEYMPYGRVLIVDDVEVNLYVAKGMMMPYGLAIETASGGAGAVEKVRSGEKYDVIFMDHMMPGMDGLEAVRIIRGLDYDGPIVALTANAAKGQSEIYLNNGFNGYLSKPIDMRELNVALNRFVRDRQPTEVVTAARRKMGRKSFTDTAAKKTGRRGELLKTAVMDIDRALTVLNEMLPKIAELNAAEIELYITTVHGLKSTLFHIEEAELSAAALRLEQAGKDWDLKVIKAETPIFMASIKNISDGGKEEDITYAEGISDSDAVLLRDQLNEIKSASERFSKRAAKASLDELKKKIWPREINDALDEISVHLLHGEFKKVAAAADKGLNYSQINNDT
jgi:CheY-like chemotaxis protein/nitrogen-specific signal transduction histidine kinase